MEETPKASNSLWWVWALAGYSCLGLASIFVIGTPSAIAGVPTNQLNQVNKAKQAEAKNYLGTILRSQQAYYLEYQRFADSLEKLEIGIKKETENYQYDKFIVRDNRSNGNNLDYSFFVTIPAIKPGLNSYLGAVFLVKNPISTEYEELLITGKCETDTPTSTISEMPKLDGNQVICPTGTHVLQ